MRARQELHSSIREFEEVRGQLEVRASGPDLVRAQGLQHRGCRAFQATARDLAVVGERNAMLVDLSVSTLVHVDNFRIDLRLVSLG